MNTRICIIGRPGSGKSTLAFILHTKLNVPVYYLDRYQFKKNWQKASEDNFVADQKSIISKDSWIIEGCATRSLDMRYAQADMCIYLNYSRWTCLVRFIKRMLFGQNKQIDDLPEGCTEGLSWKVFKVIQYLWTFESRKNYFLPKLLRQLKSKYPHVRYIEIQNDQELANFLDSCC